jgi:hypothetical protein
VFLQGNATCCGVPSSDVEHEGGMGFSFFFFFNPSDQWFHTGSPGYGIRIMEGYSVESVVD